MGVIFDLGKANYELELELLLGGVFALSTEQPIGTFSTIRAAPLGPQTTIDLAEARLGNSSPAINVVNKTPIKALLFFMTFNEINNIIQRMS
ncbi:hypothetical protein ON05_031195 (plasmid) [Acaryochloris sp. CCMEE 5410]|nr:hypothetical protein ON05_031195 [Acaryochloris sp. CCMEE 5410]